MTLAADLFSDRIFVEIATNILQAHILVVVHVIKVEYTFYHSEKFDRMSRNIIGTTKWFYTK